MVKVESRIVKYTQYTCRPLPARNSRTVRCGVESPKASGQRAGISFKNRIPESSREAKTDPISV